jgi:hypothetical protein
MPVGISGIEIAEQNGADHAIERLPTGITAFVGRALKGPVNRAIAIKSFAEFQSVFGGLWQPSTLSYAVEHYFENGGRAAWRTPRGRRRSPCPRAKAPCASSA